MHCTDNIVMYCMYCTSHPYAAPEKELNLREHTGAANTNRAPQLSHTALLRWSAELARSDGRPEHVQYMYSTVLTPHATP
jgi:hypothetical protein